MLIYIIYGILSSISLLFLNKPQTFILLFNYIFNTPRIYDLNVLVSIYFSFLVLILILITKHLFKNKFNIKIKNINYRLILFFIVNTFTFLMCKNKILSILSIKHIIMELLIYYVLLLFLKKIKIGSNKDNNPFLFTTLITILITTYLKINGLLIIYFLSRLFKLDHKIIIKYIVAYIISYCISFILINISIININYIDIYSFIGSLVSGIYLLTNYHQFNYSKLKWFYLGLCLFLIYYFR